MNSALYNACYKLISSLTKIMLRKGIAFNEFIQVVKQAYVDTCEKHLLETEGKATTSRIAIATGLTRKDVAAIRKTPLTPETISKKYNRSIRVISGWLEDQEFCTPGGFPEVLPINGIEKSFSALVERYSGNMTTRAMMDELESVGIVKRIEKEHVSLQQHAYVPTGDEDESLHIMGTDVSLLISTIDHNMTSKPDDAYYQRKVFYNDLPEECMEELRTIVKIESQRLLEKYHTWMIQQDRDRNPDVEGSDHKQVGVGIYYFEKDTPETEAGD